MPLSQRARRAYVEARQLRVHGTSTGAHVSRHDVEVWMSAFDIADEADVSPWDALLLAVRRRAQRVRAVDRIIAAAWEDHRRWCRENDGAEGANPEVPNAVVRTWMVESRNEERLMARTAKMAIDAGVADALVRRMELEGQLAVDAMLAGLDELELTSEQRMKVLAKMHNTLAQLPSGAQAGPGVIPGVVVEDPPDREEDT